jgi:hypothetical protein
LFIEHYVITLCKEYLANQQSEKAQEHMFVIVHNVFTERTSVRQYDRVRQISERIIAHECSEFATITDLVVNPLLNTWFRALTVTADARACVHYMFKARFL